MGTGLCDGMKVRPRRTAFGEFPVGGTEPRRKCAGVRSELRRDREGPIHGRDTHCMVVRLRLDHSGGDKGETLMTKDRLIRGRRKPAK